MRRVWVAVLSMVIVVSAFAGCSNAGNANHVTEAPTTRPVERTEAVTEAPETEPPVVEMTEAATTEVETTEAEVETSAVTEAATDNDAISAELKEYLEVYESFIDEYCEFMIKYKTAGTMEMITMLSDYMSYMAKLAEMEEKMDAYDSSSMTTAESLYYTEVILRCTQKLIAAAQ